MESLLYAVVHENTNLQSRLKGLEVHRDLQNAPVATKEIVPPVAVHLNASNLVVKHVKPPKPPMKPLPIVQSNKGSSSTHYVTFRR